MGNMRFKVGDRVRIKSLDWYNENKTIHGDVWFDNAVFVGGQSLYCGCELTIRLVTDDSYHVIENDYYWTNEMIECKVKDDMSLDEAGQITDFEYDGLAYILPEGYIFKDENGNVINATKIVLEKKKKEYPKTYGYCCDTLDCCSYGVGFDRCETSYDDTLHNKLLALRKLIICRDAYWKIAGEEMGLDSHWEPDWDDDEWPDMYYISFDGKHLEKETGYPCCNMILIFPTEEMRDEFYENFKEEIEICKELL